MVVTTTAAAMAVLIAALHAPISCPAPSIRYDSDELVSMSRFAAPGHAAASAYRQSTRTVILRSLWDADRHEDERKLYHELTHHILTVCLGVPASEQEPIAIAMEELAP